MSAECADLLIKPVDYAGLHFGASGANALFKLPLMIYTDTRTDSFGCAPVDGGILYVFIRALWIYSLEGRLVWEWLSDIAFVCNMVGNNVNKCIFQ